MQKVITITTHTNIIEKENKFTEKEYPSLNKYLNEGYVVSQVVPVVPGANTAYMYSLTFVLTKD